MSLVGAGANAALSCELLSPFDQIEPVPPPSSVPRRVGARRWRRAARALIGRSGVPALLRAATAAEIDVLPHQLEPAVAVLQGDGCRLLLADEVGLGKTIQACLIVAELRTRGAAERALILTPPGLRDQWQQELSRRFHLDATVVDARAVRRRAAELPPDVNPWTTWPVVIASVDFVKRPEVLSAVLNARWDVVVVDEAHRVANDGDRRQAASALTSRAAYVVLLTATPHSGVAAQFHSLCSLGSHGDGLLVFRRTRRALTSAVTRRIHRRHIRSTMHERRMHARLEAFAAAVRAERGDSSRDMWIALALLQKRAFSSAHALWLSVTRRLDTLDAAAPAATQLLLPLDEDGELSGADQPPDWQPVLALRDASHERRLLTSLADAAGACLHDESKIRIVRRLLHRVREPIIVFTEYRDTLAHLARKIDERVAVLHGGLSRTERLAALDAFTRGSARILLATDAASEGLNLHHACRVVVNLELPWNPMRLEQRIGRVDRIGQTRTVHVFHLVGADSGELNLLEGLRQRIAHAKADIGAPDPLDGALNADGTAPLQSDSTDVASEVIGLRIRRALACDHTDDVRALVAVARNRHTRVRLGARRLSLWECAVEDNAGAQVSSSLVSTTADGDGRNGDEDAGAIVAAAALAWQEDVIDGARRFAAAAVARAEAVARSIEQTSLTSMQPGLFDRRAHFAHAALTAAHDEALSAQRERQARLTTGDVRPQPPRLRLLLVPAP